MYDFKLCVYLTRFQLYLITHLIQSYSLFHLFSFCRIMEKKDSKSAISSALDAVKLFWKK